MSRFAVAALVTLTLTGCAALEGGAGKASGVLTVEDPETGELIDLRFDGGAVTWDDDELGQRVVLTTWGVNFHCDYAQVTWGDEGGKNYKRRQPHYNLSWNSENPGSAFIQHYEQNVLGAGGTAGGISLEDVTVEFADEMQTIGMLTADEGTLEFQADDCGAF